MGYSPWGHKELDMIEQVTVSHLHVVDIQYSVSFRCTT